MTPAMAAPTIDLLALDQHRPYLLKFATLAEEERSHPNHEESMRSAELQSLRREIGPFERSTAISQRLN